MQAATIKESKIDKAAAQKIVPDGSKKPPQINQDLTNKVFSNIEQMSGQAKGSQIKDKSEPAISSSENKGSKEEQYKVKN